MNRSLKFLLWSFLCLWAGCLGFNEPPFPGSPPVRAVYGTPPPAVNPAVWFQDVKQWGAMAYFYYSPHLMGNFYRQQAGLAASYAGENLRQVAFLSNIDPAFTPFTDAAEATYEEKLALEAYEAGRAQGLDFYYCLSFPVFPVQDLQAVQKAHPEYFRADGSLDLSHPGLPGLMEAAVKALKAAMPELKGIGLLLENPGSEAFTLSAAEVENMAGWLPALTQSFSSVCNELGLAGLMSVENMLHTNRSRREALEILNRFPDLMIWEKATWPEETTLMPFLGHIPPADTALVRQNPLAVEALTDTEFLGQGRLPAVLPRWWQYLAQQSYLRSVDLAMGRVFQGDSGGSAINFNRLNLHLFLQFLEDPKMSTKAALQRANEEMFGYDFPSRLTAIMIIAEDVIQAFSAVNFINLLDDGRFPSPQFLDRDYLARSRRLKAIDDLFEPPGTPLYTEDAAQPDTLWAGPHWRWQREVTAQPVDQYLLDIENAINWLDQIQKEVDYLTLEFPPEQRRMFVEGYRDLLLLGRGMYQFVQGAAVHHRWYRLHRISREEAQEQLAPIVDQLRLIAAEAEGSALELQQRMRDMAAAFENLQIEKSGH